MAGLGRAPGEADPDRYEEIAAEADVLVVGGGIAGLERRGRGGAGGRGYAAADERVRTSAARLGWRGDADIAA